MLRGLLKKHHLIQFLSDIDVLSRKYTALVTIEDLHGRLYDFHLIISIFTAIRKERSSFE
jgi:hypothetical protein